MSRTKRCRYRAFRVGPDMVPRLTRPGAGGPLLRACSHWQLVAGPGQVLCPAVLARYAGSAFGHRIGGRSEWNRSSTRKTRMQRGTPFDGKRLCCGWGVIGRARRRLCRISCPVHDIAPSTASPDAGRRDRVDMARTKAGPCEPAGNRAARRWPQRSRAACPGAWRSLHGAVPRVPEQSRLRGPWVESGYQCRSDQAPAGRCGRSPSCALPHKRARQHCRVQPGRIVRPLACLAVTGAGQAGDLGLQPHSRAGAEFLVAAATCARSLAGT